MIRYDHEQRGTKGNEKIKLFLTSTFPVGESRVLSREASGAYRFRTISRVTREMETMYIIKKVSCYKEGSIPSKPI